MLLCIEAYRPDELRLIKAKDRSNKTSLIR